MPDDEAELRRRIDHALQLTARQFNVKTKCQRVKRNPADKSRTLPTYQITVAYQFPSDPYFHNFDNRPIPTAVPVEISFNDIVCESNGLAVEPNSAGRLQVCTLEDIIAEKLRSLLQQPLRKRNRSQDVFDISRCLRQFGPRVDRQKIRAYLIRKATERGIDVRRTSFNDTVREMAHVEYDNEIRPQTGVHFIEFAEAYAETIALVESLNLPP